MNEKYNISAKEGDKRVFKPILQGHLWKDHKYYGLKCTVIQSGAVYDVHKIHFDGMPENAVYWASGYELHNY